MANITAVIYQIIMLFLVTAIGWLMHKRNVMTVPVIKGVNALLLQVAWPCMIIMTTQKTCTTEIVKNFLTVAGITAAVLAAATILVYFLVKKTSRETSAPVFSILAVMPNAGFVGMPIIKAVYGDTGLLYLAAFLVGFNLIVWTIGVFLFSGVNLRSLKNLLNPGFISAIIGTALFLLHVELPTPLLSAVNQLGSLTTPLAMLLLGARLNQISMPVLKKFSLWSSCILKLIALPLVTFAVMHLMQLDPVLTGITVMCMSMPAASVAQLLAEKNGDDIRLAVAGVSISMLLCLITVPMVLLITL